MGKQFEKLDDKLTAWIGEQRMFFVSTAPLSGGGLINCSPKGLDSFRVLDELTVCYLDLTGSGVETIAHLRENGRITIMFCAFEGGPKILRLYGSGEAVLPDSPAFDELYALFEPISGVRSIIKVKLSRIQDSCGYAVPLYQYQGDRDTLIKWADSKGEDGVTDYQNQKNKRSLDGLPGLGD